MAAHLDLEEQEQLAELKHFWNTWGNLISWVLIAILGSYAAWNGWQYWQRSQASQASALYDEVDKAVQAKDLGRIERATSDMKDKFGRTVFAQQAALLAAQSLVQADKPKEAQAWLRWVSEQSPEPALRELARVRLAALQWDSEGPDQAMQTLEAAFSADMQPLASDLKGDLLLAKGQSAAAIAAYKQALTGLGATEYARVVQAKLAVLGAAEGGSTP